MTHYLSLDPLSRLDGLLAAVHRVINREGLAALSLRAVARENNMSPASVNQHFGPWNVALALVTRRTGQLRYDIQESRVAFHGAAGLLPEREDELPFHRVWLALNELARPGGEIGNAVRHWQRGDADTIRRLVPPARAEELRVVVDGLTTGVCRLESPLPLVRAQSILTALTAPAAQAAPQSNGGPQLYERS